MDGSVDGATVTDSIAYGRPVRTIADGFDGAKVIQERVYDALGRVSGITLPHTAAAAPNAVVPYDRYSYDDNLKRLTCGLTKAHGTLNESTGPRKVCRAVSGTHTKRSW